jgi:hypothetical protein
MKKTMILLSAAVAALAAFSCAKDNSVKPTAKSNTITFQVGFPEIEFEEDDLSKVSFNSDPNVKPRKFKWDAGDKMNIFSYNYDNDITTPWGDFVTASGGVWAYFSGELPDSYAAATHGDKFFIAAQQNPVGFDFIRTGTSGRYDLKFNIPAVQDGTGLKYALFAQANTSAIEFDAETTAFSHLSIRCYSGLIRLNIVGGDVRSFKVTLDQMKNHSYCLASAGEKKDISHNCTNNGLSGGGSKSITVTRNGELLSGDIFIVSRQTNANASNGYAVLTFEFTNSAGKICTKRCVLADNPKSDGTADKYYNISTYNSLTNLGTVDLTSATFVDPTPNE